MSKNVIFCFSGTGNCLDIAKNIAKGLGDTDIIMMRKAPETTNALNAERVGFVFPCYAGGLPGKVEEYVRRVAVGPDAYKFAVCSCAAYPGLGLSIIDSIVDLDYWSVISHQSACIWLMPHTMMMPPLSPEKAQKRSEEKAARIASDVLAGKKLSGKPAAPAFNKAEAALWPKLSLKKAAMLQASDACIGCGQCEKLCPRGNIHLENGRPVFGTDCIQCLSCLQFCPSEAIHMGGATVKRERYRNSSVSAQDLMKKRIHID